ncbi:MAG: 50S ribosomal protein L4 [candidate division KSB1 bacterium]|nr:50S ribosomal protein L4 [candidate division KSB1 bacterium]MDZ7272531.1 50S ribosomal protein L4 [candidate division KSB1 bacterium]MDZ7284445.1 50S ribosomal protein L4 [candidate division KSB1 bacterium]MDZ7297159.1 50S ribosomal protein L4 [candidate division KSB1 bacterium]MDZ7306702.1 50S ribosomal protein L4 [candidate division KSB1 bacterium]
MQVEVYTKDGQKSGRTIDLPDEIFGIEPNRHVIYLAVKAQQANQRQGTHKTKTRREVSGGGKKPWKQKGRGVARAGSTRSPLWVGGGRVFGPQPRDYSQSLNQKVKKLARRSALSLKAKAGEMVVVEDFTVASGKTREMAGILKNLGADKLKTLLLIPQADPALLRASRNLYRLRLQLGSDVSTFELLNCQKLFIQESAVSRLAGVLQP